jgi:TRAP-type C4-dicarboxylate transport system permease small subunit
VELAAHAVRRIIRLAALGCIIAALGVLARAGYRVWDPFAGARQAAAQRALYKSWGILTPVPVHVVEPWMVVTGSVGFVAVIAGAIVLIVAHNHTRKEAQ